jgi:hypothetical protein
MASSGSSRLIATVSAVAIVRIGPSTLSRFTLGAVIPVIVALVGLALLVVLALAVAWQERRRIPERAITYGVEESIAFVCARVRPETLALLRESGVRRILEWSVRYLQDPEVRSARDEPPVAGGADAAGYVQDGVLAMGFAYDGDLIVEVLEIQTEFLSSLGAVGEVVEGPNDGRASGAE